MTTHLTTCWCTCHRPGGGDCFPPPDCPCPVPCRVVSGRGNQPNHVRAASPLVAALLYMTADADDVWYPTRTEDLSETATRVHITHGDDSVVIDVGLCQQPDHAVL